MRHCRLPSECAGDPIPFKRSAYCTNNNHQKYYLDSVRFYLDQLALEGIKRYLVIEFKYEICEKMITFNIQFKNYSAR